jgi:hypothetical protein
MTATLAGTNLAVTSTNNYEAATLSSSSATLTDNAILALKKTSTPSGSVVTTYPGVIQAHAKAQNGVSNVCYDAQFRSSSLSAATTTQTGTLYFTSYQTNGSNVPVSQSQVQHNQTTFRYLDTGFGSGGTVFSASTASIGPSTGFDNTISCGSASFRYTIVYATTGTINTSDANYKEQIQSLEAAELRVATAVKGLIKKFKWKDAVAKKGDAARIHVGVIAQEVEAAFVAEGLDPTKYALFCEDTWWEKAIPNPAFGNNPTAPETLMERYDTYEEGGIECKRKGIRYDQLLAFVIAAL